MNKQPGTNSVADINPEDIESMTILTGALLLLHYMVRMLPMVLF